MDINMNDPNWRLVFSLISEHQLMMLEKSLSRDKKNPSVTRREGSLSAKLPLISE